MTDLNAEDQADYFKPGSVNGDIREEDEYDDDDTEFGAEFNYGAIFDAPDFASIVRGRRSAKAKDYETRVKSVLKSGVIGALRTNQIADAAAILQYGPGFAAASGDLADANSGVAKMVDLITAPESPYVAFFMVAIPMVAQLFRNHESELRQIPEARKTAKARRKAERAGANGVPVASGKNVSIHLPFGRRLNFRVGFRFNPLSKIRLLVRVPTSEPNELAVRVFSDERLRAALRRQGINIVEM